jgi:hypothetical protein
VVAELLREDDDAPVDVGAVGEEFLDRCALDAQSLGHAEVLVEDDDEHGVVVDVPDRAEVAPAACAGFGVAP